MTFDKPYDVVIIGSGLGGLLSGVMLAKEGLNVCIIEKDKQAGGCLQTFSLQKKVFDSCVHYIGGLGEGHTLNRIFSYAGIMDSLRLKPLDSNGFDMIAMGDDPGLYPQAIGADNFVAQLLPYFPKEKVTLEHYIATIKEVTDRFPLYNLRNGDAAEKSSVTGMELTATLRQLIPNEKLRNVLAGNNLLYAGVPGVTPFYQHALVLESYMHSAHKVVPGSSQISKYLWQQLQAHGGTIIRNTAITQLVEQDGKVTYAATDDGRRFYGKQFIAAIHPATLLSVLDSKLIRPVYRQRIHNLEQTSSSFMLNLVLQPAVVPFRAHNIYWNRAEDPFRAVNYNKTEWPANYALFFTEDPANGGFADTLSILCYMHYDEVRKWKATINHSGDEHDRGPAYEAFKEERSAALLRKVMERLPELSGNIVAQSAATPLTYRDYTGTPEGSLYGILKDVNHPAKTTIATRTKIPNLLLTGQNVNLHGVLGVSITAVATCAELLGMEYLLDKIKKQKIS